MAKFMASVAEETFQVLMGEVKSRGISVQELLRAVIIPDWGARSQDGKYDHNLTASRAASMNPAPRRPNALSPSDMFESSLIRSYVPSQ